MIAFLAIGGALSIVALKFGIEAVRTGQKNKTDYVIILGAVAFLIGSNVAGIVIAVGGYLLRKALK